MTKRALPHTPARGLKDIRPAFADACDARPFGQAVGEPITDATPSHPAPTVCLKFRGRELMGREGDRVTKVAPASFVVNSAPEGADHGLETRPWLAFAPCDVTAHLALDLVVERDAEAILDRCGDAGAKDEPR